jgi:hypothetical protein
LNYAGKFDAATFVDGQGFQSPSHVPVDSFTAKPVVAKAHHVPEGAFVVPDPNLIFHGEFKREGVDLVLSHDGHEFVVHDYFRGDKRAAIASPDGAHLTGDIVSALTGHVQYAQAAPGAAAAQVIGHVTKLTGSATAIRNGVSVILNNGDNVEKGDVVSTGSDSTLGITFIDGTVFGLSSNARMVLNEMVYDPNGTNNSSLLSLVAGTITFVAGETAKHGDMKVDTPVATMGIRGTAVLTQIDFVVPAGGGDPQPQASFQVLVEPNGTTGSYILFDKVTLLPIATVNQAGQLIQISGGNVSISNALLSPDVQKLITDVFTLKFTDNNTNTKLTSNTTDTLTQTSDGVLIKATSGATAQAHFANLNQPAPPPSPNNSPPTNDRVPGPPVANSFDANGNVKTAFAVTERAGTTGDATPDKIIGFIRFVDQNLGDRPTVQISLGTAPNYVYKNAGQQDVTGSLSDLQKHDIAATQIQIDVVPDAGNTNTGFVSWSYTIPDDVFDFLGAGETLTLTYMVRVDNNFSINNETTFIPITITITGTNDQPAITSSVPTITFAGGTSVPGGPLASDVPTSGTLTFKDVDLTDTHTVSVKLTSASLPGGTVPPGPLAAFQNAMSVVIAAGADSTGTGGGTINWSLADLPVYLADFIPKGEVLTLVYTVTVKDSQGATAEQTITVTIKGTDAPAVVWIATDKPGAPSGGFWKDAANWESGTVPTINDDVIVITDQLHGLTPSYPVTIDAAAFAKSITMNDFGGPPPKLINLSSLTISGALNMSADSILNNAATGMISVGGKAEILGTSVLTNAGHLTLAGGGDFAAGTTITNSGTIELSGGMLKTLAAIHNAGGTLKADLGTTLIVDATTVDGGTIAILGTLELDGTSLIENGALNNSGTVSVKGTAEFANETVSNTATGAIEVLANGLLTIDQGSAVTNVGDIIVDATGKLVVNGASILGAGTVTGNGEIDLLGNAALSGGVLNNNAVFSVIATGNALNNETVTNAGTMEVLANAALAIDQGSTVDNAAGNIVVDGNADLTLDHATISGGSIEGAGSVDVTGASKIDGGASISVASVTADAKLTLDGVTVSGSVITDNASIELDHTVKLEAGVKIQGGAVTNTGTLEVAGPATLLNDVVTNNGTVKVDGGQTLTFSGTEISGGAITGTGTIDVIGNSVVDGHAVLSTSAVTVEAGKTLTLDTVTVNGTTISDKGSVTLEGTVKLTGGAIIKGGSSALGAGGGSTALYDWGQLGSPFTVLGSPQQIIATDGSGGSVSSAGGNFELRNQGFGWSGNFAPGTHLLWDRQAGPDITIRFANPVSSAGAQIQADYFGPFTAEIIAYDLIGNVIGTVSENGVSTSSGDNSAIFIGLTSSSADIGEVKFFLTSASFAPNDFAIGPLRVGEGGPGGAGPVVNNGTLEISGAATLLNDIVTNHGTVTVDGSQTLTLSGTEIRGGAIDGTGTIDVTGDSAIGAGATLSTSFVTVENGVTLALGNTTVSGTSITDKGVLKVGSGKTLSLNGASVTGGQVNVAGTLSSTGSSTITNSSIGNDGLIEAIGGVLALVATGSAAIANAGTLRANGGELDVNGEAIANTGTLAAINGGTVKLISTVVTDGAGTVSIASGSKLGLSNTVINGGTISIAGTLDSTGTSAINDGDITNTGTITVTAGTLTIDPSTITNHSLIQASGGELDVSGDLIINTADIKAINHGTLKLADVTISNGGGTVTVDATSKLYLSGGSAINGGSLANAGHLYGVSGSNTVSASVTNTGTIEVQSGLLDLAGGLNGVGLLVIDNGGTLELAGATAQSVTFAGGADTLQLDKVAGQSFTGTISGQATQGGTFTITGAADITTSSGDALDFTASNGSLATPATIVLTPTGALTGAANGLVVSQNGVGNILLTATGDITGLAGNGISLSDSATGSGDITVNNVSGKATGTGANSVGLFIENLNTANTGNIAITQLGGAVGGAYGIDATTHGGGNVDIHAGGTITGSTVYGIRARSYGTGSETVTTAAGSIVTSGSSGIVAVNRATSIATSDHSTITVTAYGTINSGSSLNQSGNAPAGIQAGYTGATSGSAVNSAVNGTVVVDNHADITAAAGYGIHAYNYGNGDVTVTTAKTSSITAADTAIGAFANGGGNVSVTNEGSATGAAGISAVATGAGNVTIVNDGDITSTSIAGIIVTQNDAGATGSTHITNSGAIAAPAGHAAIFIQENTTGSATIDNSGVLGPADAASVTADTYAVVETGGAITINNTGHINGNISVASATFNNELGGTWTVAGTSVFGNLSAITNDGTIDLHGASISGTGLSISNSHHIGSWGTASIAGTIVNTGAIEIHDGALTLFGSLSGSGSVTIDAGATLELEGTVSQTISFGGDGAKLQIDTKDFGGSIAGFAATDKIDLSTIKYDGGTSATYDPVSGDLVVSDAYGHQITLKLVGADYSNAHFAGSDDGHGGTLITLNAADDASAGGPVIDTSSFQVWHSNETNTDLITNLSVIDTDPGAAPDTFTVTAVTAHAPDSSVDPASASGSLDDINLGFENGITYDPGETPPGIEQITLTVTDTTTGSADVVHFIFDQAGDTSQGITLQGTSGKDVIFATTTGDTLTGCGGKDQFVFAPGAGAADATHTITDFIEGEDRIDLRQFSDVGSISDLQIEQLSGDTLVTWQQQVNVGEDPVIEHEQLLLKNVTATLKAGDFIFHVA